MTKQAVEVPVFTGDQQRQFLETELIESRVPSIRSSDFELILHCPFQYYLSRRLGLIPIFQQSQALSHGSWFHTYMEHFHEEESVRDEKYLAAWKRREVELDEICRTYGIIGESKDGVIQKEERFSEEAKAWCKALYKVRMSNGFSFVDYCTQDYWQLLGTEVSVMTDEVVPRAATFDVLLYHKEQNSVWIVDYKTTAMSPIDRLRLCPIEFQTRHYTHILEDTKAKVLEHFDLPKHAKVGGMIHVAVQKPTIKFGIRDRDFEMNEKTLKRGPRKGQTIVEKNFYGEPKLENYIQRCEDWYKGAGDFLDKKADRDSNPPVSISVCSLEKTDLENNSTRKR